jgi:hypothetical protein
VIFANIRFGSKADFQLMSPWGPGFVKTCLIQGRSELHSQLPCASSTYQCDGIRNDEIEMEILPAISASEFSHSQGQKLTFRRCPLWGCRPKADIP